MTFPATRKFSTLLAILAVVGIAMPALADEDNHDRDRDRDHAREYRPYYPRPYYAYPPGYVYAPPPVYYAPPPPPPVAPSFNIVIPFR
jgi:hypothetical protein